MAFDVRVFWGSCSRTCRRQWELSFAPRGIKCLLFRDLVIWRGDKKYQCLGGDYEKMTLPIYPIAMLLAVKPPKCVFVSVY